MRTANEVGGREPDPAPLGAPAGSADRFRILRRLGAGASGEVFLAEDAVHVPRALKIYRATGEAESGRLLEEFARLTALAHPNVVRVHDLGRIRDGEMAGRPYLLTDYVPGPALTALATIVDEPTRLERFAAVADALADALAYLHGRGVVHGDLTPANVHLTDAGQPVIFDFGLSAPAEQLLRAGAGATGTLGFLAPESLVGERSFRSDLYALGATLYAAWTGTPPFGTGLDAVRRAHQGPPPLPSALQPGLPASWESIVMSLLASAPELRPASARELLRQIRRLRHPDSASLDFGAAPHPEGDPLAGILVGFGPQRLALAELIERLAEGTAPVNLVVLQGQSGSGRRSLVRRVLRDARISVLSAALPDFDVEERSVQALLEDPTLGADPRNLSLLSPWDEPARLTLARLGRLVEGLEERARARPLCLVLPPGEDAEALARVVASGDASGRLLAIIPSERPPAPRGQVVALPPLGRADIASLAEQATGQPMPPATLDDIHRVSAGQPALASLLVRRWVLATRQNEPFTLETADAGADVDRHLDQAFQALSGGARRLICAVALQTDQRPAETLAGLPADQLSPASLEAQSNGWLTRQASGALALPSPLHTAALLRALGSLELRSIARAAADALPEDSPLLGEALVGADEPERAVDAFRASARRAFEAVRLGEAAACWTRASALDPGCLTFDERLAFSGALGVLGRYPQALAAIESAGNGTPRDVARVAERQAWLLSRRGQLGAARSTLERALEILDGPAAAASEQFEAKRTVQARLARVLVSLGELGKALDVARGCREGKGSLPRGNEVAREAEILALAYSGRTAEAERCLDEADETMAPAQLDFLRGLCLQLAGRPTEAAAAYRASAEAHAARNDLHGVASATFNLGIVLAETGHSGEALPAFERAIRELARIGATTDLALALFNAGLLSVQLGDLETAERLMHRTRDEGRSRALPLFDAYAACLEGDLHRRRRAPAAALAPYAQAAERFETAGNPLMADLARLSRAEALVECGRATEATALCIQLRGRQTSPLTLEGGVASEAFLLTRARVCLATPTFDEEEARLLAEALESAVARAELAHRTPVVWRAAFLSGRLFARLHDPRATARLDRARRAFEEMKMLSPLKFRSGFDSDAEAPLASADTAQTGAIAALIDRAARAENRLKRLLRINKRLNSELRLSRVLETIIDTVIELTDAERGFLLLKDGGGELQIKVARNIDQSTLDAPAFAVSHSIAKQAADQGEPVITVDAAGDERFREALSVTDLHLRSVLAVPLVVKGNVVGTIYVDHRLRKGAFGEDDVALVLDFAEQGAIAIENARLLAELRRRERQVDALNRRLERDLKVRHEELTDVRQELKETREAAALRYDYRQIVGRTPRMLELFRLLDRVTDTSLPVVVQGESGSGKELVARAIHFNGPRRERSFVTENCAAIPETLLESTLFGYVRGAFTGADRDTRGLFAVADGGTLFLDEVAEMSPGMQGKLLRVLQDGEFRRVGSERSQKVDVRIIVATNKDLERLVGEGKFRQDLFYRLSVVRLTLPPLRERRDDIPLLVKAFLDRLAADGKNQPKSVAPAAMAKLMGFRWPGNVRELENEILRAAAFAGATITVADLSAHVAAGEDGVAADHDSSSLVVRARVERLERSLIREALSQCAGNQTKAAEALGLSRFGLQKKLRRYGIKA